MLQSLLAIDKLYHSSFIQTYKKAVNEYENTPYWSPKIGFVLGAVSTFIFCMAVLSTVYFSSRMYYMLGQHGIDVTQDIHRDILHLQVQFLTAMLALYSLYSCSYPHPDGLSLHEIS